MLISRHWKKLMRPLNIQDNNWMEEEFDLILPSRVIAIKTVVMVVVDLIEVLTVVVALIEVADLIEVATIVEDTKEEEEALEAEIEVDLTEVVVVAVVIINKGKALWKNQVGSILSFDEYDENHKLLYFLSYKV